MSKAFTKEDDDRPEAPPPRRPALRLPPGAKNYLTAAGADRFRQELKELAELAEKSSNPSASAVSAEEEQQRAARIQELRRILQTATIVRPPDRAPERVRIGTAVTVRSRNGEESRYSIVGVDEADPDGGRVSWQAPLAKALLNARVGDRVPFHSPAGDDELEVVAINY